MFFQLNQDFVVLGLCPVPVHEKVISLHCLDIVLWDLLIETAYIRKTDFLSAMSGVPVKGNQHFVPPFPGAQTDHLLSLRLGATLSC